MRDWIHQEDLQRAVQSRSHFFLSNIESGYNVNWTSMLDLLDANRANINMLDTLGGVCTEYRPHPYLMALVDTVKKMHAGQDITAHLYFSFTKDQMTNGKHRDTANVFFIGLIGNTQFKVYGEGRERYKSYRVGPGDLIYIPRGMDHDTKPMGPRIGISIGIEADG